MQAARTGALGEKKEAAGWAASVLLWKNAQGRTQSGCRERSAPGVRV